MVVDLSTHAAMVESMFKSARRRPAADGDRRHGRPAREHSNARGLIDAELIVAKPVQREALSHRPAYQQQASGSDADRRRTTEDGPPIGAHVLLVEDEAVNAAVAQGYLAELGCTCVWVDNGSEAVARSATERFDMIMMDLNMPDMDGFATARLIREREAAGRSSAHHRAHGA